MRGPTAEENLNIIPSDIRVNTKTSQAYLDLRRKILSGELHPHQILTPKAIDDEYKTSNTSTQIVLLRLAGEGLIKVQPIKERVGANNAAINEYIVADLNIRHRMLSTRHGDFIPDISQRNSQAHIETKIMKIQYADSEIASLLNIDEGKNVIFRRTYQYQNTDKLVAISDAYFPFWLVEVLPELEKPDSDAYQLMIQLGRKPSWCTETIDVVPSTAFERQLFGLSSDDPSPLLKILRRIFDDQGNPILADFLTDRGDTYRLHYSFPLFTEGIPEPLRDK
jgi:DNA-binding GntR family transcriptional regulator